MAANELNLVSAPMVDAAPIPSTAIPTMASSIVKAAKSCLQTWYLWNFTHSVEAANVPKTRRFLLNRRCSIRSAAPPKKRIDSALEILPGILAAEKRFLRLFEIGATTGELKPDLFLPPIQK